MTVIRRTPFVYVISVNKDTGAVRVKGMSRELFLLAMNTAPEDYHQGFDLVDPKEMRTDVMEADPMMWGNKRILAIQGEIVTPEPISEVTTWRIADG